ncbi:MAG: NADH-quinone oxidoreductase subunit N [Kofleriaceae bacterium]|nr:NADH-quinone oxidoreductase subunit N [Myxococcales bacterium]MCB9572113.1 NADH-quinone oxidoreductase subunit N [Kofleriaceae bacterium]
MTFNNADLLYATPIVILVVVGMLLVIAEAFFRGRDRSTLMGLAVAGAVASSVAAIVVYRQLAPGEVKPMLGNMLLADRFGFALVALFGVVTALAAMAAPSHQRTHGWEHGEFYGVLLLSASGMAMMAMAGNLVTVFLGVETMSIGVYVMCALRRRSRRGNEAAMKYFLMGAFATGFLLYGIALLYGAAGTTALVTPAGGKLVPLADLLVHSSNRGLVVGGVMLLVVAFGFKLGAVPFHMWAPDVYEGAPTPVTAFMAAGVKAAATAAMIRVFAHGMGGDVMPFGNLGWASPMVVIAAITITVGNIAAVRQDNIKRMLAYSSISHGGVILVGLIALGMGSTTAQSSLLYYLVAYSLTTMGAFAVVSYVGSKDRERLLIDDWAGLATRHPAAALAMTVCLLSLGGMPPTGGFFAKFYVFKSAMEAYDSQLLWLVIIGVVNSAISIYYYLRIVTAMYFRDARDPMTPSRSPSLALVMALCPLVILEMGVLPGFWLKLGL